MDKKNGFSVEIMAPNNWRTCTECDSESFRRRDAVVIFEYPNYGKMYLCRVHAIEAFRNVLWSMEYLKVDLSVKED